MLVQDFLRNGGTLSDLDKKYAISARRHTKFNNLVCLKYSMIDSPMGDPITQECRGLVLDEQNNWEVVCHPFNKFFNYGEGNACDIDWASARVQQKYDGSLCTIYYYNNEWHVATTGTPDASGQVNDFGITFERLFWSVWATYGWALPDGHEDYNFMFELMCPENRVVVRHKHRSMVLLGVRNHKTGQEFMPDQWSHLGYACAQSYPLSSYEDIAKSFDHINPLEQEGYVVVDKHFNRVKVKHPGYVALHHMRDNLTTKGILQVVRAGEHTELATYFPEWADKINGIANSLTDLKNELVGVYDGIKHIESQKEFALLATKTKVPDFLFRMRADNTTTPNQYFKDMRIAHLQSVLGLKTTEIQSNE